MITITDALNSQEFILKTPVGSSMRPMLHNKKEQLVIQKISRPLKINDVVLFKRNDGQYVLHRIVCINKEYFIIRGDNCVNSEYVYKKQIIGLLSGFYRKNKYINCDNNLEYKIYVIILKALAPIIIKLKKLYRMIKN